MKTFIKQLIPPLLLNKINKLNTRSDEEIFSTFDEAVKACQSDAYQNNELVKMVVQKNLLYREKLKSNPTFDLGSLRTLIALGAFNTVNKLNVIDFGGGGGNHYTIANAALGSDNSIRWHVVETTVMSMEAQRLANDQLKFFDNIDDAKNNFDEIDLVFTNSALQYCPDPLFFLKKLTSLNALNLFITRTPFLDNSNHIITTQSSRLSNNGPGALPPGFKDKTLKYPITYVSRKKVEELLKEKYDIRFITEEGSGGFGFKNESITMNGYFCVRK